MTTMACAIRIYCDNKSTCCNDKWTCCDEMWTCCNDYMSIVVTTCRLVVAIRRLVVTTYGHKNNSTMSYHAKRCFVVVLF